MDNLVEIVLQAIDNASSVFSSVSDSADEMGSALETSTTDGSSGFEELETSAQGATGTIQDVIDYCQSMDGNGPRDAADAMDQLEQETSEADQAVQGLGSDLDIINSSMLLQTAEQVGQIGDKAEAMAQDMNTAAISVGQLATQTGIAEPEMVSLVNTISNATFPNDEAMMYVKSLDQMGVSSENFAKSATGLDRINDAFFHNATTVNSLGQELGVLGVDMNNVESAYNALAYANANTVGGMQNYYSFLRKYDAEFKELGYNVDQSSIIIAAATQKYGGGRAALSGLSDALKESAGDSRKLEEALGMQAGTLDNATAITGQYEGQLEQLASEEAQHKTLLDQLGAAWEDLSLSLSGILSPLGSVIGAIGSVGQFGLQISGISKLISSMRGAVTVLRDFSLAQTVANAIQGEGVIASAASAIGLTTEAAAGEAATVSFAGLAVAEGAALWPILAIIAAIGLLVVAVYEIGKAFGWWSDVGTMFEAISAGAQRLWNAFINHPDVQAAISAISGALGTLWGWIQQAGQAVLEFFGISSESNFDIVRAVIDSVGAAWEHVKEAISVVVGIIQTVIDAFQTVIGYLESFGGQMSSIWTTIVGIISPYISQIIGFVMSLINTFNLFRNGQMDLPTFIVTILSQLWNAYLSVTTRISSLILSFAGKVLNYAITAGRNFLNGIIGQVKQVPGRVYSLLMNVVGRISSAIQSWISTASSKVQSLVSHITSPFSGVASAISGALSGVVSAITSPFQQAWDALEPVISKIKDGMKLIGAAGGDSPLAAGGDIAPNNVVSVDNSPITVENNINLTLDLRNVPSHISTEQLGSILNDKGFIRELVNNRDFQLLDSQAKERLNLKINRARGI